MRTCSEPLLLQSSTNWQAWNKPTGMTVHNEVPSVADFLKKSRPEENFHFVNRLDRETSGILITTDSPLKVAHLQEIWQKPETQKVYVGIHRRRGDFKFEEAVWNDPLTDKAEGRLNPQGASADRIPCSTRMIPLLENRHLFLSLLVLESGRQHQIRKHAVLHNMELAGDFRYGDKKYTANLTRYVGPLRLGLHATALRWTPESETLVIRASLPEFFTQLFPEADRVIALALLRILDSV